MSSLHASLQSLKLVHQNKKHATYDHHWSKLLSLTMVDSRLVSSKQNLMMVTLFTHHILVMQVIGFFGLTLLAYTYVNTSWHGTSHLFCFCSTIAHLMGPAGNHSNLESSIHIYYYAYHFWFNWRFSKILARDVPLNWHFLRWITIQVLH